MSVRVLGRSAQQRELLTPATATPALTAIPDCAKAAQSGNPGAGDPGCPLGLRQNGSGFSCVLLPRTKVRFGTTEVMRFHLSDVVTVILNTLMRAAVGD